MKTLRQDDALAQAFFLSEGHTVVAPFIGLVVEDDGDLAGAVILNDYHPGRNIEVSAIGRRAFSPRIVRDIVRYCFARVRRITAHTSEKNTAAIKALLAIGFEVEGIMPEYFGDDAAVVLGLLRNKQRII